MEVTSLAVVSIPQKCSPAAGTSSAAEADVTEHMEGVVQIPSALLQFLMDSIGGLRLDVAQLREENVRLLSQQPN